MSNYITYLKRDKNENVVVSGWDELTLLKVLDTPEKFAHSILYGENVCSRFLNYNMKKVFE